MFMDELMKKAKGKVDARMANQMLAESLNP